MHHRSIPPCVITTCRRHQVLQSETVPQQDPASLAVGMKVRISGIKSRLELNGQCAVCTKLEAKKGRWAVRLQGGEQINLKESSLTVVDHEARIASFPFNPQPPTQRTGICFSITAALRRA